MAGTDKSYIRKANPTITTKTRVDSTGKMVTYREVDLYEHNHTPGSHVMDEQGICISNAGMDTGYYQPEQYREQNPDGTYKHYVEKSSVNSYGRLETYNEFTQSTAGAQGTYTGDTGERKIIPRSYVFTVGQDVDNTGELRINLTGNITKHVGKFAINTEDSSYVAGGVVNAWTILQYSAKIVFVLAPHGSSNRATVDQMIKAPVYLRELTHTHPSSQAVLIDPRPITIDNLSAQPEWIQNGVHPGSNPFGAAQYY